MSDKTSNEWWNQRLSAIMMIFSSIFIFGFIAFKIKGANLLSQFFSAITSPFWAIGFIMLAFAIALHGAIGMKIILEDYVHSAILRKIFTNLIFIFSYFMVGIFALTVITINIKYAILH